jgi:hypothetical protein
LSLSFELSYYQPDKSWIIVTTREGKVIQGMREKKKVKKKEKEKKKRKATTQAEVIGMKYKDKRR